MRRLFATAMALLGTAGFVALDVSPAAAHPQPPTYTVTSQTPAGPNPHFPAFDPTSGHVLVSNVSVGTVSEVTIGAGPTRSFTAGTTPHTVVVDDATRRAFVTNKGSSSVSVIDLITGGTSHFAVGPNPHGLAVDNKFGRLYVTSIDADRLEVYDLATLAPITTVPVGDGPWGVAVGPGQIAVTDTAADTVHLIDRDSLEVRDVVTVGAGPWNSTFLAGTLYVTLERTGEVVAVRHAKVAWRTPVGASPHGISADHQRNTVLAAVTGTNQVAVLDARGGRLLQSIPVTAGPAGMTIDRRTGRVFVGNQAAGLVTTLEPGDMADVRSRSRLADQRHATANSAGCNPNLIVPGARPGRGKTSFGLDRLESLNAQRRGGRGASPTRASTFRTRRAGCRPGRPRASRS